MVSPRPRTFVVLPPRRIRIGGDSGLGLHLANSLIRCVNCREYNFSIETFMLDDEATKSRIARDDEERRKTAKDRLEGRRKQQMAVKDIFRDAAGKGPSGPVKTTAAGYKAAAMKPHRFK